MILGTHELNIILHYNLDQKKERKKKVTTKQTSSIKTDHSLVITNINNTKLSRNM